jgi:Glycosyltransferase family 87
MLAARVHSTGRTTLINLGALVLALCWFGLIATTLIPDPDQNDFGIYRKGVISFLQSGDPYLPTSGQGATPPGQAEDDTVANNYIYPPILAYLLQPFGLLNERQGQLVWFGLNGAMLGGLIALSIRLSNSVFAHRYWGLVALGTLIIPPTRLGLQLGQTGILLAFLLVASLALARRRAGLAGTLLALASLIKLYPAFLGIYYALRRPRRVLWWCNVAGVLIVGLSVVAYGITPYISYVQRLRAGSYYPYAAEFNISLYGLWSRLFVPNHFGVQVANLPLLATILTALTGLGVLGLCFWAGASAADDLAAQLQHGVWLCGMMLLSPLNGVYNLVLLLFPLLVVLHYLDQHPDRGVRNWLLLATALVCVRPLWSEWSPALDTFVHVGWGLLLLAPPFYGLLIYLVLLAQLARRRRNAADAISSGGIHAHEQPHRSEMRDRDATI